MKRLILIPLFTVIAILAIAGGVGYWIYNNYMYYSTDDAQVTGQLVNVSAPGTGTLSALNVSVNQKVNAGQTLGTVAVVPATSTSTSSTTTGTTPTKSPAPKTVNMNITSPINGTIVAVNAVQGEQVAPGVPLIEVTDQSNLYITAYVDESAINNIQTGQSVDISIDAYKDTKFTGHVKQIVPAAASEFSPLPVQDNASGNFTKVGQRIPVIISLDNYGGKSLIPGISAEVTIHLH